MGDELYEIEVQNESDQTQRTLRFIAVPRIGEGVRLQDAGGLWDSYDVIDVWYQRSPYGDIWVPFIHVRKSGAAEGSLPQAAPQKSMSEVHAQAPSTLATAVAARR